MPFRDAGNGEFDHGLAIQVSYPVRNFMHPADMMGLPVWDAQGHAVRSARSWQFRRSRVSVLRDSRVSPLCYGWTVADWQKRRHEYPRPFHRLRLASRARLGQAHGPPPQSHSGRYRLWSTSSELSTGEPVKIDGKPRVQERARGVPTAGSGSRR